MEPRGDSHLTRLFAEGAVAEGADAVARELVATDHLYRSTLYGEYIEEFMRKVARRTKEKHGLTWKETWEIVSFYGPIALKLQMARMCGMVVPDLLCRRG